MLLNKNFEQHIENDIFYDISFKDKHDANFFNRIKYLFFRYENKVLKKIKYIDNRDLSLNEKLVILSFLYQMQGFKNKNILEKKKFLPYFEGCLIDFYESLYKENYNLFLLVSFIYTLKKSLPLNSNKSIIYYLINLLPYKWTRKLILNNTGLSLLSISQSNASKVTVIVPTYNVENYIVNCIESILNQDYKNIEIIIIDDNSTDDTASIVENLYKDFPHITIIKKKINKGPFHSKNIGIKLAKGEYITFLDGDDMMCKKRISSHIAEMNKFPNCAASISSWVRHNSNFIMTDRQLWPLVRLNVGSIFINRENISLQCLYFQEKRHSADLEYFERIKLYHGDNNLIRINKVLTYGAFRADSLTLRHDVGYSNTLDNIYRRQYLETWKHEHDNFKRVL